MTERHKGGGKRNYQGRKVVRMDDRDKQIKQQRAEIIQLTARLRRVIGELERCRCELRERREAGK